MVLRDDNFERLFWILREIARMAKQFFPPEIYGRIIFEFMESSLFMEMLTSSWRAVTKSHSFFPFFFSLSLSPFFPPLAESRSVRRNFTTKLAFSHFKKYWLWERPRWKIIRPIDASRPRKRDFKFKFPCNRISRQKSRLIRPIERRNAAQSGGPNYE